MPDIFVSWGLPDAAVVGPLCERLRDAGFNVWSYDDSMLAGVNIPGSVQQTIDQASMAIVVLSAETAARPWIVTEIAWCTARQRRDPAFRILPVRVGDVPAERAPLLLANQTRYFDLTHRSLDELSVLRLVEDVRELLGTKAPLVVPARILAMNLRQFDELFPEARPAGVPPSGLEQRLEALCQVVGMPSFPALRTALRQRYRERGEDFAPFTDAPLIPDRMVDVVHVIQREVNQQRRSANLHPIVLQWCSDDLFRADTRTAQELRDQWQEGSSLLIVDSISVQHADVLSQLQKVPPSRRPAQAALLWVPPYTRHTVQLRQVTDEFLQAVPNLHTSFRNWSKVAAESHMAFDIATAASLCRWLYMAFAGVAGGRVPLSSHTSALRSKLPAQGRFAGTPSQFYVEPHSAP